MEMESSVDLPFEGFHLRESLWKTVEKVTLENSIERSEIKIVIGESLVDETVDLHKELLSLYEIWKDFNQQNTNVYNLLPDPPFLRENLEKQISVLVELLQQKLSIQEGRQVFTAFLSDEERDIIKSVSRGNSAASVRKLPSYNPSPIPCSRSSSYPVDPMPQQEDVNVFEIDKLAGVLRQGFEDERKNLLCDVEKIQMALINGSEEKETTKRRQSSPTIKELQYLNNKLEKKVLSPNKPSNKVLPLKTSNISQNSKNLKWSNNFQKPVKLSPSPPITTNTSSYKHPNLLRSTHSAGKMVSVKTLTCTTGRISSKDC